MNTAKHKKSRRNRMLAKIHIEKEEQGISEEAYRDLLRINFGVESAADLNDGELESLIHYMTSGKSRSSYQVEALKEKAGQMVLHSNLSPERFRGLVKKVCGVEDLRWYNGGPRRMKRLLAALNTIIDGDEDER